VRVLVTGGHGQLGRELVRRARDTAHQVVAVDRDGLDITEPDAAAAYLRAHPVDAVVNCAAYNRVDDAESHREETMLVNAQAVRLLAEACRDAGVRLCHLSTDYVFDGERTRPYDESATPHPLSVYGQSKLAGEEQVRALCEDHLVVRTSWLFGQDGPNFVLAMLRLGRERSELRVVDDQRGGPTWTGHLAPALLRLLEVGAPGTYHLSGAGETTWHEFAAEILAQAGLATRVLPISAAEYGAPAPRPAYSVLDNAAWRELGEAPLPSWRQGLSAYLDELRGRAIIPLHDGAGRG
jgi:dTDP-4-dehydrorhamnose reductase